MRVVGATGLALSLLIGCGHAPPDAPASVDAGVKAPYTPPPNVLATASRSLIAERLAHLIWSTTPDDALTADVASLELNPLDGERVSGMASAMLRDERAHSGLAVFYRGWLELSALSSAAKPPGYEISTELLDDMLSEVDRLTTGLTLSGADFRSLFFSPSTFVNAGLAKHYGMPGTFDGSFVEVQLDGETRFGLLTTAAVLAKHSTATQPSWPSARGMLADNTILCAGFATEPPIPVGHDAPTYPVRKAAEEEATNSACQSCHRPMNQAGYAFMAYDTLGRWDASHGPFDLSGFVVALPDQPRFDDLAGLLEILATSEVAERCLARQWMTRALNGHDPEMPLVAAEDPNVARALAEFQISGHKLGQLILEVTKTPAFLAP